MAEQYDHMMGNPIDVSGTTSSEMLSGNMNTLRRDMGTSAGDFISKIQRDDAVSISNKFRK